jgi:histone deacetylase 1/2
LNKAQYGCIESARLWYNTVSAKLVSMGYEVNPYDPCVFNKIGTNGKQITVVIYVDDILATSVNKGDLEKLISAIEAEYKTISVKRGDTHEYLGMLMEFRLSGKPGKVRVTMQKYTVELLDELRVSTTADDPAASTLFDIDQNAKPLEPTQREMLHRTVAQLLYLATRTRPDILLPVIFLTTRVSISTKEDQRKLNRVLMYLRGTTDLGIILGADDQGTLRLHCYADASFGVHPDGKSHSGTMLTLGSGPILAKSVKQKIVVKSSTEAELVTLSDATSTAAGMSLFLSSIGLELDPVAMYQDNQSTMRLAENGRSNSDRTKHIKLRYFFVKQYLDNGEFELEYCPTESMVADILTKPLHGEIFKRLRAMLLGYTDA